MKLVATAAVAAVAGLFLQGLAAPTPAHAACADDAAMTKEMAMAAEDGDGKTMALEHVAMAMEKADAKMEEDCMAEVVKAKAALDGEVMEKMEEKKTN